MSNLEHKLRIFETQNEKTKNHAKTFARKILRTRSCRCKFIKYLLPEKRKENM